jgi:hypothetical protein
MQISSPICKLILNSSIEASCAQFSPSNVISRLINDTQEARKIRRSSLCFSPAAAAAAIKATVLEMSAPTASIDHDLRQPSSTGLGWGWGRRFLGFFYGSSETRVVKH